MGKKNATTSHLFLHTGRSEGTEICFLMTETVNGLLYDTVVSSFSWDFCVLVTYSHVFLVCLELPLHPCWTTAFSQVHWGSKITFPYFPLSSFPVRIILQDQALWSYMFSVAAEMKCSSW